ncbi:MAG: valine--tRNA ligase [Treponema sp.]
MQEELKSIDLEKSYNPKTFENHIYKLWLEKQSFTPKDRGEGKTFTVIMPPPNVTGILHIGHALDNVLQDIVVRYKRMCGFETLWVPGCDHAGIATQNVVEKTLRKEGIEPKTLTREDFVNRTFEVAMKHKEIIQNQLRTMGVSVDWDRFRFTMDTSSSKAVNEVFCTLYEEGLIYKGEYLVNWCSSCGTALSDEEVTHEDESSFLYYILYPLLNEKGEIVSHIEIATTRPETMLADVAVACNPDDERYKGMVGRYVLLPIINKKIPVVADSYVDKEFGSGLVKITPAHDRNDWEVGKRHNLEVINILNKDGTLNNHVPEKYRGLTVKKARVLILKELEELNLLKETKKLKHAVGKCYRCGCTIEPYLSKQWFVKMDSMANEALKAWEKEEIVFHPKKWENTYTHWLKNIRDWCISRQLVWGHRIPVWMCENCGEVMVSRENITKCKKCSSSNVVQDEDVLDTWFSSWLWPFSTLGWPQGLPQECSSPDYKKFYPTNTLVTGYDIIFFWVSRMIMSSLHFTKNVPFHDIYLHGLVRDKKGRKMSKSLGNGIDPLLVIDEYGADALKFTLSFLCAQGQDILIDMDTFKMGSRFANKIWNATRYIFSNLEGRHLVPVRKEELKEIEKWIIHSINETALKIREALETYRYSEASQLVYEFFWNNYCDWYVEGLKLSFKEDEKEKDRATSVYLSILEESLRLLHPFLSFITEELYQKLPINCVQSFGKEPYVKERFEVLATSSYPQYDETRKDYATFEKFSLMQSIVRSIRALRLDLNILPSAKSKVYLILEKEFAITLKDEDMRLIEMLSRSEYVKLWQEEEKPKNSIGTVASGFQVFVIVDGDINIEDLKKNFAKRLEAIEKEKKQIEGKLANKGFIQNAPSEVIEKEKVHLLDIETQSSVLCSYLEDLDKIV